MTNGMLTKMKGIRRPQRVRNWSDWKLTIGTITSPMIPGMVPIIRLMTVLDIFRSRNMSGTRQGTTCSMSIRMKSPQNSQANRPQSAGGILWACDPKDFMR